MYTYLKLSKTSINQNSRVIKQIWVDEYSTGNWFNFSNYESMSCKSLSYRSFLCNILSLYNPCLQFNVKKIFVSSLGLREFNDTDV